MKKLKLTTIVLIIINILFFSTYFIYKPRSFKIIGMSMFPTMENGQIWIAYSKHKNIKRGDIVVFLHGDLNYVKRIIGLPGDLVITCNGMAIINGTLYPENYIAIRDNRKPSAYCVPKGSYFVMGDNRALSYDSRNFGFVDERTITYKTLVRIW